ncbi:unnamed protein product [Blepharisma stoltei]|uniref:Uncharacterized protein n=1 Tax=Blepharisma stoltei TaxID=1481888 RepID=A0AAU9IHY6_9CILI|nr:unnamed protein product [Blepharisma stoltei]
MGEERARSYSELRERRKAELKNSATNCIDKWLSGWSPLTKVVLPLSKTDTKTDASYVKIPKIRSKSELIEKRKADLKNDLKNQHKDNYKTFFNKVEEQLNSVFDTPFQQSYAEKKEEKKQKDRQYLEKVFSTKSKGIYSYDLPKFSSHIINPSILSISDALSMHRLPQKKIVYDSKPLSNASKLSSTASSISVLSTKTMEIELNGNKKERNKTSLQKTNHFAEKPNKTCAFPNFNPDMMMDIVEIKNMSKINSRKGFFSDYNDPKPLRSEICFKKSFKPKPVVQERRQSLIQSKLNMTVDDTLARSSGFSLLKGQNSFLL